MPLDKLLQADRRFGSRDPDVVSTLAGRLARLDRQLTKADRDELERRRRRLSLADITHGMVEALDPDRQHAVAQAGTGTSRPDSEEVAAAASSR